MSARRDLWGKQFQALLDTISTSRNIYQLKLMIVIKNTKLVTFINIV